MHLKNTRQIPEPHEKEPEQYDDYNPYPGLSNSNNGGGDEGRDHDYRWKKSY